MKKISTVSEETQPLGKFSQMIKLAVTVMEREHYTLKCNVVRTDAAMRRKTRLCCMYLEILK